MSTLVKISDFLAYATPHALRSKDVLPYDKQIPAADQWGYIMGYYGRIAPKSNRWYPRRCFDCNGLAEGFYLDKTGININTFSRTNYSTWCKGYNSTDMSKMPQIPGTAVFVYGNYAGLQIVHHVAYLWKKYGPGPKDWLIVQASGSSIGVIISRLGSGFNRWGLMKMYFDYDVPPVAPEAKHYHVVHGDSWARIARVNGITKAQLKAKNSIPPNPDRSLIIGETLLLP